MTDTLKTFPNMDISNIITDTGVERPKTELEMTYLEKNNADEAIS